MSIMYKVCKRVIERGNYPEDILLRIEAFHKANLITEEEYTILVNSL